MATIVVPAHCLDDETVERIQSRGVSIVDRSREPYEVKFEGPYLKLVEMLWDGWIGADDDREDVLQCLRLIDASDEELIAEAVRVRSLVYEMNHEHRPTLTSPKNLELISLDTYGWVAYLTDYVVHSDGSIDISGEAKKFV